MGGIKQKIMQELHEEYDPNYYSGYYDSNYYSGYYGKKNMHYQHHHNSLKYVDVVFEGYDKIYTYILLNDFNVNLNDYLYIQGNKGIEKIQVVKIYSCPPEKDRTYRVLPIVKILSSPKKLLPKYFIRKYNKKSYFNLWNYTPSFIGGYHKEHLEKYNSENPTDTFVIIDSEKEDRYLGSFCIITKEKEKFLSLSLACDYFDDDISLIECNQILAQYIIGIRDFIGAYYADDIQNYCVELKNAGPQEYERNIFRILNESHVMHIVSKYKIKYWKFAFDTNK